MTSTRTPSPAARSRAAGHGAALAACSRRCAAGHSTGGAAAAATLLADRRVDAGIDLDGGFRQSLDRDLDRPLLMMSANFDPRVHLDWDAAWERLTGWPYSDAPYVGNGSG